MRLAEFGRARAANTAAAEGSSSKASVLAQLFRKVVVCKRCVEIPGSSRTQQESEEASSEKSNAQSNATGEATRAELDFIAQAWQRGLLA